MKIIVDYYTEIKANFAQLKKMLFNNWNKRNNGKSGKGHPGAFKSYKINHIYVTDIQYC
jgi:hypothetical protein